MVPCGDSSINLDYWKLADRNLTQGLDGSRASVGLSGTASHQRQSPSCGFYTKGLSNRINSSLLDRPFGARRDEPVLAHGSASDDLHEGTISSPLRTLDHS